MGLISTIFAVLTVIVGGISIMLVVSTKTLRDSRDDFAVRIKQLEEERLRDKEQIGELNTAVGFWRSAATGDKKLDSVLEILKTHVGEARQNGVVITAALGHLGQAIDHMNETSDHMSETSDRLVESIDRLVESLDHPTEGET